MGIKHFLRKKKSEHPITEEQKETPKLLNNLKSNLLSLKITVILYLAWSKMGEQFTASSYLNFER